MRLIAAFALFAFCCLVGCSDPLATEGQGAAEAPAPTSEKKSDVSMAVQVNKIVGEDEETEFVKTFNGPDTDTVRQQVKAIDWTNTQLRPTVGLGRLVDGGIRNLSIKGTLGKPNVDGQFRAYWLGFVGEVPGIFRSPPLESVDAGIDLLLLFRDNPDKLGDVVADWEQVE